MVVRHAKRRTVAVVIVISAVAGFGALGTPAAAAADASITADPSTPGATATHQVTVHASADEVGNSLSTVRVDYHADGSYDGSIQDVGVDDVRCVGLDTDGDGRIERSVADDLESAEAKNVGETLLFEFDGNYDLRTGDAVIVVFDDATNPSSPGEYAVEVDVNVQSSADPALATLTVDRVENETLRDETWTNSSVDGAVIENSTIADAHVSNVSWTNGTTTNTTWTNGTTENVTWTNGPITNSTVENSTATNVTVTDTVWTNSTVDDTRLNESEMTNVSLSNTTLENVALENVTLENVTVENVTLENVTVENATITDSELSNVTVTNATVTNVSIVDSSTRNVTVENVTAECVSFTHVNRSDDVTSTDCSSERPPTETSGVEGCHCTATRLE